MYNGCSLGDVHRSIKQEVVVQFTYNMHLPSKHSIPFHTHSSSCLRQDWKANLIVGWRQWMQLWIYCFCKFWILNAGNFLPSQVFFNKGEQLKVTWSQIGIVGGMGQNWMFCSFTEVTVTLALWVLLTFWDPFFSSTVDDITFLIMSNNHMADKVNTILCMVIG